MADKELVPVPKPADPRAEVKRKLAGALLALIHLRGMSQARAWRTLHPNQKGQDGKPLTDQAARRKCQKVLAWYQKTHPPNFDEMLARNHLGIDRIVQEVELLLQAQRYEAAAGVWIPDYRARTEGIKFLLLLNKITPRTMEAELERQRELEKPQRVIETGPPLTADEWLRMSQIIREQSDRETLSIPELKRKIVEARRKQGAPE